MGTYLVAFESDVEQARLRQVASVACQMPNLDVVTIDAHRYCIHLEHNDDELNACTDKLNRHGK